MMKNNQLTVNMTVKVSFLSKKEKETMIIKSESKKKKKKIIIIDVLTNIVIKIFPVHHI